MKTNHFGFVIKYIMFLLDKDYWEIKETENKGRGVFAKKSIRQATVIGDYVGKLVHLKDVDFEAEKRNLYLMYYTDEVGIYPNLKKPGIHLINHSCSPNCWMIRLKNHTIVFALKKIKKGSELTISYLLPPKMNCSPCNHNCFCKSKNCTGSMHLTESGYKKWQEFQDKESKKDMFKTKKLAGELKPLKECPRVSKKLISEIKALQKEMHQ